MEFFDEKVVKLTSSDNELFELSASAAKISKLILEQLEEEESDEIEIPFAEIRGEVMRKVVTFMNHYKEDPLTKIAKPLKSSDISTLIQPWYYEFIRGDPQQSWDLEALSELLLAANFMSIEPLLELTGASFASQVREKDTDQLKSLFHIEGELPAVDCKTVRQEYPWAIENINIE